MNGILLQSKWHIYDGMKWMIKQHLHQKNDAALFLAELYIELRITICSMSAAGGWGPGLPLVTCPLAIFARHWLWTRRISLISFSLTPLDNPFGDPHWGPYPYMNKKILKFKLCNKKDTRLQYEMYLVIWNE